MIEKGDGDMTEETEKIIEMTKEVKKIMETTEEKIKM